MMAYHMIQGSGYAVVDIPDFTEEGLRTLSEQWYPGDTCDIEMHGNVAILNWDEHEQMVLCRSAEAAE